MTLDTQLEERLSPGKIAILGIGDVKMKDDGVGPYIVSRLHEVLPADELTKLVNGGTVPELYREEIGDYGPDQLVIIDSAEMKETPGHVAVLEKEQMVAYLPISSHSMPMTFLIDWMRQDNPDLDVFMIGIQPKIVGLIDDELELAGEGDGFLDAVEQNPLKLFFRSSFAPEVEGAANNLVDVLAKLLVGRKG